MTVVEMAQALCLKEFAMPEPGRQVTGGYAGDLLSWVMGRAQCGEAWITIMSNRNIVAVATLCDVSAIILSEGVEPDDGVAELAKSKGINLLGCAKPTYQTAAALERRLGE